MNMIIENDHFLLRPENNIGSNTYILTNIRLNIDISNMSMKKPMISIIRTDPMTIFIQPSNLGYSTLTIIRKEPMKAIMRTV